MRRSSFQPVRSPFSSEKVIMMTSTVAHPSVYSSAHPLPLPGSTSAAGEGLHGCLQGPLGEARGVADMWVERAADRASQAQLSRYFTTYRCNARHCSVVWEILVLVLGVDLDLVSYNDFLSFKELVEKEDYCMYYCDGRYYLQVVARMLNASISY